MSDEAKSQKLSLGQTSVSGARGKEILRKTLDFRDPWAGEPSEIAELGLRSDLSMGCKREELLRKGFSAG